ncbi:MAG: sulfurtransferase [Acidobacteria bacterium]|nr:MAG: sulfurtransferase [Acidobacteriota bacterium]
MQRHLADVDWAVVDCRFSLDDPERGRRDYQRAHIPGAVYAHLNEDLSGPVIPGRTGRHPLPEIDRFAGTLGRWGIDERVQVVAYDDSGGAVAARLWWMLRWLGHDAVAVLDGGWPAWQEEERPAQSGVETRAPRTFVPRPRPELIITSEDIEAALGRATYRLIDARAPERYRGEQEPIDPIAGHIPGAVSAPFAGNLDARGRFRSPEELRARFQAILGDLPPERAVLYCGSGVTAAHNLLAMAHAGLGEGRLYVGSWSEWITDPRRPIATSVREWE